MDTEGILKIFDGVVAIPHPFLCLYTLAKRLASF